MGCMLRGQERTSLWGRLTLGSPLSPASPSPGRDLLWRPRRARLGKRQGELESLSTRLCEVVPCLPSFTLNTATLLLAELLEVTWLRARETGLAALRRAEAPSMAAELS